MKPVTLRPFNHADISRIAELANDERISINLRDYFPNPYTLSDAQFFMDMIDRQSPKENHAIFWGAELVGNIGIHPLTDIYRYGGELGYWLGTQYWGQGIMTKAIPQILKYGFDIMQLRRIQAGVISYNIGSIKVLEKCGLTLEGISKDKVFKMDSFHDEYLYAITSI